MVYVVDTNIFLRVLIKQDENIHQECVRFLEAIKKNLVKAVTCHLVLAEVVWTLQSFYGFDRKTAAKSIDRIVYLRGLKVVDGYEVGRAVKDYGEKKVKFVDAMLASIQEVQDKQWTVVSYDKEFDKLGVVRKEPKEVLDELEK